MRDAQSEQPFSVAVDVRFGLQPDWSLTAQILQASLTLPEQCRFLPASVDATPALRTISQTFLDATERQLAVITAGGSKSLRSNAEILWAVATQPFAISDERGSCSNPRASRSTRRASP